MERESLEKEQPSFKTTGPRFRGATTEYDPTVVAKVTLPEFEDEVQKDAVQNIRKRTLSVIELEKVQLYVARAKESLIDQSINLQAEIHSRGRKNLERAKELTQRGRTLDKREKEITAWEEELSERESVLRAQQDIFKDMPEDMDDTATRKWLNAQRRWLLATYRSLAEHAKDERVRMQALDRLSNEDRGKDGKSLHGTEEDEDFVIAMPTGEFGIPK